MNAINGIETNFDTLTGDQNLRLRRHIDRYIKAFASDMEHSREAERINQHEIEQLAAFGKLHWYEQKVFELWVELGSLQKVADFTTIDYNSLKKTVRAARIKARKLMEEQ